MGATCRARMVRPAPPRVLFIEDTVPLRHIGSGFVRSNDIVRAMAKLGYAVTVLPAGGYRHPLSNIHGDLPDTVEVMHDHDHTRLRDFLLQRSGYYGTVWIGRTHNFRLIHPDLVSVQSARIILDTEAIVAVRQAAKAELAGELFDHVGSGRIRIEINQRYALKDVQQAHRDLESRKTTGSSIFVI